MNLLMIVITMLNIYASDSNGQFADGTIDCGTELCAIINSVFEALTTSAIKDNHTDIHELVTEHIQDLRRVLSTTVPSINKKIYKDDTFPYNSYNFWANDIAIEYPWIECHPEINSYALTEYEIEVENIHEMCQRIPHMKKAYVALNDDIIDLVIRGIQIYNMIVKTQIDIVKHYRPDFTLYDDLRTIRDDEQIETDICGHYKNQCIRLTNTMGYANERIPQLLENAEYCLLSDIHAFVISSINCVYMLNVDFHHYINKVAIVSNALHEQHTLITSSNGSLNEESMHDLIKTRNIKIELGYYHIALYSIKWYNAMLDQYLNVINDTYYASNASDNARTGPFRDLTNTLSQ